MSSFELVNHQIKHLFGGIEAEKNSSLEYLECCQRKIVKAMQRAEANHRKIYEAVQVIKRSLIDLNENYLQLSKQNKHSGGLINQITSQLNHFLQDLGEDCLTCANKMERKVQSYVPNMRVFKEQYIEKAENLQHYRTKVGLLRKGVEKQSKATVKQDQHQRFQRNKEKLRNAEREHDDILIKTTKRFIEFNNEGMKDVYNDYLHLLASVSSNAMAMSHGVGKYLKDSMEQKELERAGQYIGLGKLSEPLDPNIFLEHLISQRQIRDYLQNFIDQELLRMDRRQRVGDYFRDKPGLPSVQYKHFQQFGNVYGDEYFKQRQSVRVSMMAQIRQEEPVEDLLQMESDSERNSGVKREEDTQILDEEIVMTPTVSKDEEIVMTPTASKEEDVSDDEQRQRQEKAQRFRDNLAKFNKLCQQSQQSQQATKVRVSAAPVKRTEPNADKKQYQTISKPLLNNQTLLNSDEFFDIKQIEALTIEKQKQVSFGKSRQELARTTDIPSSFEFFDQHCSTEASQFPTFGQAGTFKTPQENSKSFEAFDFLGMKKTGKSCTQARQTDLL